MTSQSQSENPAFLSRSAVSYGIALAFPSAPMQLGRRGAQSESGDCKRGAEWPDIGGRGSSFRITAQRKGLS